MNRPFPDQILKSIFSHPSPSMFYQITTTYYHPKPPFVCHKCSQQSASRQFVAVDEQRECLLETCSCCGHERTLFTGDSKKHYDLPSVEEAKSSISKKGQ